jgi:hypothetical protein
MTRRRDMSLHHCTGNACVGCVGGMVSICGGGACATAVIDTYYRPLIFLIGGRARIILIIIIVTQDYTAD